jgi:uncharacterized membrane protein
MASQLVEQFLDKTIQMLKNDTIKKKIEIQILQPFTQYIIELIFPYVIIICVIFGIMIILLISTLGLLFYKVAAVSSVLDTAIT